MCKFDARNDSRRIDPCMKRLVTYLKLYLKEGYKPVASCCGHGKYPMTVVVFGKEIFSDKRLSNVSRFYKRDKQGYYFIPEVSSEK